MGCRARVVVNGDDHAGLAAWAVGRIEELESRWSRFRPGSEISALNQSGGQLTPVSHDTFILVDHAMEGWQTTGGRFDPTMLDHLISHGYDRTHAELAPATAPARPGINDDSSAWWTSRCGEIVLVPALPAVMLPPGVSFDPGGIGKGLGADMVATELMMRGASGALVDLGGDLRVTGDHPDSGTTWTILVDDPIAPGEDRYRLGLADGGIATSSQLQRRWAVAAGDRHHLLDPRNGDPSTSPVAAAVVAGAAAWEAEVLAKGALIAGFDAGATLITDSGAVGALFDFEGVASDVGLLQAAAAH